MEANTFDDIRPYNDAELREALKRIAQWGLIPQILKFIYPQTPVEESMQRLQNVQTVKELQTSYIVDHEFLDAERVPDDDEIEADAAAKAVEDAAVKEAVSAGKIGAQVELSPQELIRLTRAETAALTKES